MQVTFDGHLEQSRTIQPMAEDIFAFRDAVKSLALADIKYQNWDGPFHAETQRPFVELCEKFGVDYTYKKDRVAFANALIDFI